MNRRVLILVALVIVNIVSALGVVQSKQATRNLFHELQVQRVKHDQLATAWAQIQLEESAWASPDRVSQVAGRMGMLEPRDYVVLGQN